MEVDLFIAGLVLFTVVGIVVLFIAFTVLVLIWLIVELILVFVADVVIFADLIYGILVEGLCVKLEKVVVGGLFVSSISKLGVE